MKPESTHLPFSITPDAEGYLRHQLNQFFSDSDSHPALIMTEYQSDGQKLPRWKYNGVSFVLDELNSDEKPDAEYSEHKLFGRSVAIQLAALNTLSGHTLALKYVTPTRGVMGDKMPILVIGSPHSKKIHSPPPLAYYFSVAAMTILGGCTGMGVVWIAYGLILMSLNIPMENLNSKIILLFPVGWLIGAVISFFFFRSVFKPGVRTQYAQAQMKGKYFGYGGPSEYISFWIFVGIPIPITAIVILLLERWAKTVGEKTACAVIPLMVIFGTAFYFCDRLSHRMVLWLGLVGWLSTLALGIWYFKTYGP